MTVVFLTPWAFSNSSFLKQPMSLGEVSARSLQTVHAGNEAKTPDYFNCQGLLSNRLAAGRI